ncbi:MAG: chemoreceptor glutamine deamidase CheD [Gammaproteobacteria bacterium]|nr:chemoreceptor glutamine deamidase CheD [Gammaproteobacteria bacterium]
MSIIERGAPDIADVLPGFEHIGRAWNDEYACFASKILPGEYYVTQQNEVITTVLGSCISACIRDPDIGVGGMNHYMLPGDTTANLDRWGGVKGLATRYGSAAMEKLISDILAQGSRKKRLELKLFGGGKVLKMEISNVGERNIAFAQRFAQAQGLEVSAQDVGGPHPRKVIYFPKTGKVLIRRLRLLQSRSVADRERNDREALLSTAAPGHRG